MVRTLKAENRQHGSLPRQQGGAPLPCAEEGGARSSDDAREAEARKRAAWRKARCVCVCACVSCVCVTVRERGWGERERGWGEMGRGGFDGSERRGGGGRGGSRVKLGEDEEER